MHYFESSPYTAHESLLRWGTIQPTLNNSGFLMSRLTVDVLVRLCWMIFIHFFENAWMMVNKWVSCLMQMKTSELVQLEELYIKWGFRMQYLIIMTLLRMFQSITVGVIPSMAFSILGRSDPGFWYGAFWSFSF